PPGAEGARLPHPSRPGVEDRLARRPPEVPEAERRRAEVVGIRQRRVDKVLDAVAETADHLVLLRLRQTPGDNRAVELLLRRVDDRIDEPADRLAVRLGNLREALAAPELGPQLGLRQAEVVGGGGEISEKAEMPKPAVEASEEREVAGLQPLLQCVALRLG